MRPVRPGGRHGRHHDRPRLPGEPGRGPRLRLPQLQALYAGAGEGRGREQETGQQHQARVAANAPPIADDAQDELDDPGAKQPPPGTPVAVTLTGTSPRPARTPRW